MKALEILKQCREGFIGIYLFNENEDQVVSVFEIQEAIDELESQLSSNPLQLTKLTNEELMIELSSRGIDGDEFDEFADEYNNEWGEQ